MSTSISRPSDATVALLWGDRWWISGCSEPLVFGATNRAGDMLLGYFEEHGRPSRLRLLHQPASFVSVPVACPNGNRATLQAALQHEHPALADPLRAWGYEPIFGGATLLHFEEEPVLLGLVEALRDRGIEVEGAWPFTTALNLLPDDWPDTGALTAIAVADGLTVVFKHTPTGAREVEAASGEQAAVLAASTLRQVCERDDTALYLVSFDATGARLYEQVAHLERPGRCDLLWDDVARAAQTLSLKQPNQLLRAESRFSAKRIVSGVTVAALLGAVMLGVVVARESVAQRNVAADQQTAIRQLHAEVETLRQNETEIRQLRAQLAAERPGRVACAALLRAIPLELPAQVVLTALHTDLAGFRLSGGVAGDGLTAKGWETWLEQLKAPGLAWDLAPPLPALPTADFSLKGVWR